MPLFIQCRLFYHETFIVRWTCHTMFAIPTHGMSPDKSGADDCLLVTARSNHTIPIHSLHYLSIV